MKVKRLSLATAALGVASALALLAGAPAQAAESSPSSNDRLVANSRITLQAFVAQHPEPTVTAAAGTLKADAQATAVYEYWNAVPWDAYFGQWGAQDVEVTVALQRSDDGALTASWAAVVPNGLADETEATITESLSLPTTNGDFGILSSGCMLSSYGYAAYSCVYNNVGTNASSGRWENGSSFASSGKTFAMRVGQNVYSGTTCTGVTNKATGPYQYVPKGATYILNYTSSASSRYGVAGYNSAVSVRYFLDCLKDFI